MIWRFWMGARGYHAYAIAALLLFCVAASLTLAGCGSGVTAASGGGGGGGGTPANPDFSIAATPATLTLQAGGQASFTVSVSAASGFTGNVAVAISGAPSGVTLSSSTLTVAAGGSAVVMLTASAAAPAATSTITLSASSGSLLHTATVALTVQPGVASNPDFTLTATPASLTLASGGQATFTVAIAAVSGFTGNVGLVFTGAPAGVTVTPATISVSGAGSVPVVVAAASNAASGTVTVTATGTSGALTHSSTVALTVQGPAAAGPARLHYVRTDSQLSGDLSFFPQQHLFYSASTRRFFFADASLNRIHVFDARTQTKIAELIVPGAFQVDESPDGSTLWVGTQVGDLYTVDPAKLTVVHRYPSLQIGPTGYSSYEAHPMANGRILLLGAQGGLAAVDGYGSFALWNPTTNALVQPAMCVDAIAVNALTHDRSKVIFTSFSTSSGLCLYDPATDTAVKTVVNTFYDFSKQVLVPPDGKEILVSDGNEFNVFSLPSLQLTDKVPVKGSQGILSTDGNTLWQIGEGKLDAYNWRTHALLGSGSSLGSLPGYYSILSPQAADETGLIAGLGGEGVGFVDGAALVTGAVAYSNAILSPDFGPATGGTTVSVDGAIAGTKTVYFGTAAGTVKSAAAPVTLVSPAGTGIVDVSVFTATGAEQLIPEAFSYGPNVIENTTSYVTADGGGIVTLFGVGLGGYGKTVPANLRITVAGQPATITAYAGSGSGSVTTPYVQFAAPAGAAGTSSDVVVTNDAGSYTLRNGLKYLPAVQKFPLAGSSLYQGVYDATRDLYYFSDQGAVQVFSRAQGKWLAPLALPATATAKRLWGIALSPDGTHLAVADEALSVIYSLDPANPGSAKTFSIASNLFFRAIHEVPCGVAVTNAGVIFMIGTDTMGDGGPNVATIDPSTGKASYYMSLVNGTPSECQVRTLLSRDGARVYFNDEGGVQAIDVATNRILSQQSIPQGDDELALSSNQTTLAGAEYLVDTNFGVQSYLAENEREALASAVYGQKLGPDGSLLFQPLAAGIDVLDARTGVWAGRVGLPVSLAANYDALVSDGTSNVLVAITGQGDGIAVVDLGGIAIPNPLPYMVRAQGSVEMWTGGTAAHTKRRQAVGARPMHLGGVAR